MLGFSFFEIFVIGMVALIVLGPEKLPRTARTIGALMGKAQRYVSDVKSEVNRAIDLEELKKMKSTVEDAARDMQSSFTSTADDFEKTWADATASLNGDSSNTSEGGSDYSGAGQNSGFTPVYIAPKKNWRLKRSNVPKWYKQQTQRRTKVQSAAARVARYRPK